MFERMAIILSSIASAEEIRVGGTSVKSGQSVDNLKQKSYAAPGLLGLDFQPADVRDGEKIDSPSARGGGCIGALNAPMQMN